MKPISEQLAELSVRAKSAEDAMAAAQKEAHDKIVARKEQARAEAVVRVADGDADSKCVVNESVRI